MRYEVSRYVELVLWLSSGEEECAGMSVLITLA